jgi:hypothetical protein
MAWTADWANMGENLGELRADISTYIDDLFEASQERVMVGGNIFFDQIPDVPLTSPVSPTDGPWEMQNLEASNAARVFNYTSIKDGAPTDEGTRSNARKCSIIQQYMDAIIIRGGLPIQFIDHTFQSGDFNGATAPPVWSEASLLAELGEPTRWKFPRSPNPTDGRLFGWGQTHDPALPTTDDEWPGLRVWLKQQYDLLNLHLWTWEFCRFVNVDKKSGTSGVQATEALADSVAISNWTASTPATIFSNRRPLHYYARVRGNPGVYVATITTREGDIRVQFAGQRDYIDADIDVYIQTQANADTYDDNGVANIPTTESDYLRVVTDATRLACDGHYVGIRIGDHTIQPAPDPWPATTNDTADRGYDGRDFISPETFPSGSFGVQKWNFTQKL